MTGETNLEFSSGTGHAAEKDGGAGGHLCAGVPFGQRGGSAIAGGERRTKRKSFYKDLTERLLAQPPAGSEKGDSGQKGKVSIGGGGRDLFGTEGPEQKIVGKLGNPSKKSMLKWGGACRI